MSTIMVKVSNQKQSALKKESGIISKKSGIVYLLNEDSYYGNTISDITNITYLKSYTINDFFRKSRSKYNYRLCIGFWIEQ